MDKVKMYEEGYREGHIDGFKAGFEAAKIILLGVVKAPPVDEIPPNDPRPDRTLWRTDPLTVTVMYGCLNSGSTGDKVRYRGTTTGTTTGKFYPDDDKT